MDARGQVYFGDDDEIPVEDKRRLNDAERRQLEEREEDRAAELRDLQQLMEER